MALVPLAAPAAGTAGGLIDFNRDIRPIFAGHCLGCHGPEKQKGGLRLDLKDLALKGGEEGPVILPGKSGASRLLRLAAGLEKEMVMPPKGDRLNAAQLALLRAWIDQGALWPADAPAATAPTHRAFQPINRPPLPQISDSKWPRNSLDHFILARLEKEKLSPSGEADRRTLIRRIHFDLIGLPPTPEEVAAFVADKDPLAYEKLADRLLASPRHGERWARHWLDAVRFAESDGFETNQPRPNAWPYRDYVIRAFNDDTPYDQFLLEQIAGDQLGADAATGFLVAGPWDRVKSPDPVLTANQRADELHDMVSTTGSTFLGLTIGCARCHNHKFDPLPQTDYFAIKAIFAGVQHGERAVKPARFAELQAETDARRSRLAAIERQLWQFDPAAHRGRTRILHAEDSTHTAQLLPPKGPAAKYPEGAGRGQADDTGDATRPPTLGKGYLYWNQVAGKNVFAWAPQSAGRFRIWLSWGAGYDTHAQDAHYFLDGDGDAATGHDQIEIARADHQKFADGTGLIPNQRQWSGFLDAGVHELTAASRIFLRGGASDRYVSADVVVLQEAAPDTPGDAKVTKAHAPRLRLPVTPGRNTERFAAITARFVRFTITGMTQAAPAEPCIDELEVFTAGETPRNIALASAGAKATSSGDYPNNPFHKLAHIHDGLYGNSQSWISNERGKGWVQIEFAKPEPIDRIIWSRDRSDVPRYSDRLATRYHIEVSSDGAAWQRVASSEDRLPPETKVPGGVLYSADAVPADEAALLTGLLAEQRKLVKALADATRLPMIYAGKFVAPPDTFRFHRGDPMQPREVIAPGALTRLGAPLHLPADATEGQRRLALAKWIASPTNPLTARVIVNRLWHHHFGRGIVDTPSDLGLNGGTPSHPELLDWLASELLARNWSLKSLHRLIVTSATYRQASGHNAKAARLDSDSRLLWRFPARRLEAEALRDAILAASGRLDLAAAGGPGFDLFDPNSNYVKVYNPRQEFGPETFRRMIYQQKPRMQLDDTFGAFDCPDAGQIAPRRTRSTTPLQALNLLNSPFLIQQASFLAERVTGEAREDVPAQIQRAFQIVLHRSPTAEEKAAGAALAQEHGLTALCRALFNASEFIFMQ